jgi:hypothetical protein
MSRTIECELRFARQARGRKELRTEAAASGGPLAAGRVPRVARLLALAWRMDRLVREGGIDDYAALAELGHVSRARISQIMKLLLLAPDIQEAILFLLLTAKGRDLFKLADLQPIAALADWTGQRKQWDRLRHRITARGSKGADSAQEWRK